MELRSYLLALRKNWWVVLLLTVVATAGGLVAHQLTPTSYASRVTFYVSTPMPEGTNPQSAGQFAESRVNSYVELLSSERLAAMVLRTSGVEDLTPRELTKKITADAELNTVLVTATVTDESGPRSLQLAEGVADTFGAMVDDLDNQGRSDSIVVINTVSGPTYLGAVAPSFVKYVGLGLAAGLLLGVGLALLRELLDNTVRSAEVASALVGAPVIGSIAFDKSSRKEPLILGDKTTSTRAEAFRQLRTNLQFVDVADPVGVVLITSSLPGEGKSTTAVNLALTFVEAGQRVLIIEGDLRRPQVADYLGLERNVGLTNVLVGQFEADEVVQQWGNDGLHFLASGPIPPNPSELLGSQRMADLVEELRPQFDKIIIDAAPLLPVTDAAVTSPLADGVVFVVRHGRTTRQQVANASKSLENINARVLGTVINMRTMNRGEETQYGAGEYYGTETLTVAQSKLAREVAPRPGEAGDVEPSGAGAPGVRTHRNADAERPAPADLNRRGRRREQGATMLDDSGQERSRRRTRAVETVPGHSPTSPNGPASVESRSA